MYDKYIKRILDIILSLLVIILSVLLEKIIRYTVKAIERRRRA